MPTTVPTYAEHESLVADLEDLRAKVDALDAPEPEPAPDPEPTPDPDPEPTPTPDPASAYPGQPDPAVRPLWGEGKQLLRSDAIRPGLPVVRLFYTPGHETPGGMLDRDLAWCVEHDALPFVSTKVPNTDWQAVADGKQDVWLDKVLTRLSQHPGPVALTMHHEPDGAGGDDPAGHPAHRAMARHTRDRLTALGITNVSLGPVFVGWSFRVEHEGSARDPRAWWDDCYDWFGVDLYSSNDPAKSSYGDVLVYGIGSGQSEGNPDRALTMARDLDVDLWVPEWGVAGDVNGKHITAFYNWMAANPEIAGAMYYNRASHGSDWAFKDGSREEAFVSIHTDRNV